MAGGDGGQSGLRLAKAGTPRHSTQTAAQHTEVPNGKDFQKIKVLYCGWNGQLTVKRKSPVRQRPCHILQTGCEVIIQEETGSHWRLLSEERRCQSIFVF